MYAALLRGDRSYLVPDGRMRGEALGLRVEPPGRLRLGEGSAGVVALRHWLWALVYGLVLASEAAHAGSSGAKVVVRPWKVAGVAR